MTELVPVDTTVGDICTAALQECGAVGVGQTALAEDSNKAWSRLQWMLQQWERKRWLVYHLVTMSLVSTGAQSYSVGPGGSFDTSASSDPFNAQFNAQFGAGTPHQPTSVRPAKLESAFLRQIQNTAPNQIDYPLRLLQSREDYNKIALKSLTSFPGYIWYDPSWPLGTLFPWPVPQASIYSINLSVMEQLPVAFGTLATKFVLPYEYYGAMVYNLATRLFAPFGLPVRPDTVALAKDALEVLRGANTAIAALEMPADLQRSGIYNIFSDRFY